MRVIEQLSEYYLASLVSDIEEYLAPSGCSIEVIGQSILREPVFDLIYPDLKSKEHAERLLREGNYQFARWHCTDSFDSVQGWH